MMNRVINTTVLLLFLATGCAGLKKEDIKGNDIFKTDYSPGQIYETQTIMFLKPSGTNSLLYPMGGPTMPKSMEEYERQKEAWHVSDFIDTSTKLRVTRIIHSHSWEMGNYFEIIAVIIEGRSRGKLVDLFNISIEKVQTNPVARVPWVNPKYLRTVEDEPRK